MDTKTKAQDDRARTTQGDSGPRWWVWVYSFARAAPKVAAIVALLILGSVFAITNAIGLTDTTADTQPTEASTVENREPVRQESIEPQSDWLARLRASSTVPEVTIDEVTTKFDVMRIYTDAPDDGSAAMICFDAVRIGWTSHIEVWGDSGGIRAWTGANLEGCGGR